MQEINSHISSRLEQERRRLGHTQAHTAEIAGVSLSGYKNWKNGASIPSDALYRLGRAGYDLMFIVTGDEDAPQQGVLEVRDSGAEREYGDGFTLVPLYDVQVSAGAGLVITDETVIHQLAFRTDWITTHLDRDPADLVAVEVSGDSMEPTISARDTLLVDRTEHHLEDGIYVLNIESRALVKRVQVFADGSVRLNSDNPVYASEEIRGQELDQLNVIGRVVWIGRRI